MKKAVVTGGSSGIGKSIVQHLLEKDCEVLFTYRSSADSAKLITDNNPAATAMKVDFTSGDDVGALLDKIDEFQPDILINNYYRGTFISQYFHKTAPESFEQQFRDNVLPALAVTQKCISVFRRKKWGRIISILSSSLRTPALGTSVYNANKAYLLQMSRHWALENVKFGITSNCISPSFIPTGFHADMDERQKEMITKSYPLKNPPTTADVAALINLCLDAGPHFNGNHLFMDAGNY